MDNGRRMRLSGGIGVIGPMSIDGSGEIVFEGAQMHQIEVRDGILTVEQDIRIHATEGDVFFQGNSNSGGLVNRGLIWSDAPGGFVSIRDTWTNEGTIRIGRGDLHLGGSFTTADLGAITNTGEGGWLQISGDLDNTGDAITLSNDTGPWRLDFGGSIIGGRIGATDGQRLVTRRSELDGIRLGPGVEVLVEGSLTILNGITLEDATMVLREGPDNSHPSLSFAGGVLGGSGQILLSGDEADQSIRASIAPMTIGEGIVIRTAGGSGIFGSGELIINEGTIRAESENQSVTFRSPLSNKGLIEVSNDSLAIFESQWSNEGALRVSDATIHFKRIPNVFGEMDVSHATAVIEEDIVADVLEAFTFDHATLELRGVAFDNAQDILVLDDQLSVIALNESSLEGGSVEALGGGVLEVRSGENHLRGTQFMGTLTIGGGTLIVDEAARLEDTTINQLSATHGSHLVLVGDAGRTARVDISFEGDSDGHSVEGGATALYIGPDVSIVNRGGGGRIGTWAQANENHGLISSTVPAGVIRLIGSTWDNLGSIEITNGGELEINALFSNQGTVRVLDSALTTDSLDLSSGLYEFQNARLETDRIVGDFDAGSVRLQPTRPINQIEIEGDLSMSDDSALEITVGRSGLSRRFPGIPLPTRVLVEGDAALAGTVRITLTDGLQPNRGDTFPLISTTGAMSGQFDKLFVRDDDQNYIDANVIYGESTALLEIVTFAISGDFDLDGDVDAFDLGLWQLAFGTTTGAAFEQGDADQDGDVDAFDLGLWQTNFGRKTGSSVPEPATCAVLAFGLVLTSRRRVLTRC